MKYHMADLYVAMYSNNHAFMKTILKSRLNLNAKWRQGTPLYFAVSMKNAEAAELLVSYGADVNQACTTPQRLFEPPLVAACRLNHLEIVNILLTSPNLNVDKCDFFGKGALYYAAFHQNSEMMKLLLDRNAKVNVSRNLDSCPLKVCTSLFRSKTPLCHFLIRRGGLFCNCRTFDHAVTFRNVQTLRLMIESGYRLTSKEAMDLCNLYNTELENKEFCEWMIETSTNPWSLKKSALHSVRKTLILRWGNLKQEYVDKLPVPTTLKQDLGVQE